MDPNEMYDSLIAKGVNPADAEAQVSAKFGAPKHYEPDMHAAPSVAPPPTATTKPSLLGGLGRSVLQGATLGFGDEIAGAVSALPALAVPGASFRDVMNQNIDEEREALEGFKQEHPIAAVGGEVVGGLSTALVGGGASLARNAGMLRRMGSAAKTGAGVGVVAGAGTAEGGFRERGIGAAKGAAVGGGVGAAIVPLGAAAGAVGGAALTRTGLRPATSQTRLGRALPIRSKEDVALGRLDRSLARDNTSPFNLAVRAQGATDDDMVLDMAGDNLLRLGRAVESQPSAGGAVVRRALTQRTDEGINRAAGAMERAAGRRFENAPRAIGDMVEQRAKEARPLYEKAYGFDVSDDRVRDAFNEPDFREMYRYAQRIADHERRAGVEGAEKLPELFEETEEGIKFLTQSVPVRGIDYMKKGLDALIETRRASGKPLTKYEAGLLRKQVNDMLSAVDELVPEYGAARKAFAGRSESIEAMERGREEFLRLDPNEIQATLAELSPAQVDFYKRGAFDAARRRISRTGDGRDPSRALVPNEEMRQNFRVLFGENYDDFARQMERERGYAHVENRVVGGSPTSRIDAEREDLADVPLTSLTSLTGIAGALGNNALANRLRGVNEATADILGPRLTARGPEGIKGVVRDLAGLRGRDVEREKKVRALLKAAGISGAITSQ